MLKYKKNISILLFAILIYFILIFIYNTFFINANIVEVCFLKKDYIKGEEIKNEDIIIKRVNKNILIEDQKYVDINFLSTRVATEKINKGCFLLEGMFSLKEDFLKVNKDKEIISLKMINSEDSISYQVKKGDKVNIYYSGKTNQVEKIFDNSKIEILKSSNTMDGYTSVKLIENVDIINSFDKLGNMILKDQTIGREQILIDTIMIEASKDEVMLINNLKNYGTFSLSIIN